MITNSVQNALGIPQDGRRESAQPAVAGDSHPQFYLTETEKATRIPPNFTLSTGNFQRAWVAYCCWDDQRKIPPLRVIFGHELKRSLSARFASNKTLMEAIVKKAVEQGWWEEPVDPVVMKNILNRVDLSRDPSHQNSHRSSKTLGPNQMDKIGQRFLCS